MVSLKNVLLINAASSGATGAGMAIAGNFVANLFGLSQPYAFWGVGIFLVAFAILVFSEGFKNSANANRVQLIIMLDILWVVGSLIIVVFQLFSLTVTGYVLITGVGLWVAAMAWLQIQGLKTIA
jgi:heme/copper-type cytochrome/quinol oxidase subunit 2